MRVCAAHDEIHLQKMLPDRHRFARCWKSGRAAETPAQLGGLIECRSNCLVLSAPGDRRVLTMGRVALLGLSMMFVVYVSAVADQQEPKRTGRPAGIIERLREADANHDGVLTKEELPERMQARFDKLDANGDGKIDQAELEQLAQRLRGGHAAQAPSPAVVLQRMMAADKDGDGKISKEEAPDRLKRRFNAIDTDQDGLIDKGELKRFVARIQRAGAGGGPALVARLKRADKDGDGKISKDEVPEPLKARFDQL
ncbi:MAG TPA: hypothetical protein EYP56_02200, partial [Planctomycetaceae bacterium]|nr:hypothetical protein [Planctomycetaceae bacterium]